LSYRLLMGAAAARLGRGARHGPTRGVAKALWDVCLGTVPADEAAWAQRIAERRRALPADVRAHSIDTRGLDPTTWREEATAATEWMSLPPVLTRLLMRLVRERRPLACLELGTGFGISTACQAAALELNGAGRIVSLDVEGMSAIAAAWLEGVGLSHRTELVAGQIEDTLPGAVEGLSPVDFVLLDADHTEAGTFGAFETILPALAPGAVLVFDDIHWTAEMRRAWGTVRAHERVAASVSLRRLGIAILAGEAPATTPG
jgi:predicted O-methyltransferase YrrM